MFIYLLIGCELALLYFVFWYLYVRDPRCKHSIRGNLWGTYDPPATTGSDNELSSSDIEWYQYLCRMQAENLCSNQEELVFDSRINKYVEPPQGHNHLFNKLALQVDRALSQFNVRS